MASEAIIKQVHRHYLETMHWLPESVFHSWSQQWVGTTIYLSGEYQSQHQNILNNYRENPPRYVGIMRCVHRLDVHPFADNADRCLLIDYQNSRRMATYQLQDRERITTQDLGSGVVVCEMVFDRAADRWKLDRFVQELPPGWWKQARKTHQVRIVPALPRIQGRNN